MHGVVGQADLITAIVLGRLVTVAGDLMSFVGAARAGPTDPDMRTTPTSQRPFGSTVRESLPFAVALSIVAVIYGAVPFIALPTLGQALWISSFAQSFVNSGWPSIFAHNFGLPAPRRLRSAYQARWWKAPCLRPRR